MKSPVFNENKNGRLYKAVLVVCFQILFSSVTFCCSCGFSPFSVRHILLPELCFEGEVICIESVFPYDSQWEYYKYTFQIHEVVNGEYDAKEIEIYTNLPYGGSCGSLFNMNVVYYIFTSRRDNGLFFTSKCAMNLLKSSLPATGEQVICDFKYAADTIWQDVKSTLVAHGKVVNQKAEGEWIFYHEDGSIESSGLFVNGLKHCTWNYFYNERVSTNRYKEMTIEERSTIYDAKHIHIKTEDFDLGDLWLVKRHH